MTRVTLVFEIDEQQVNPVRWAQEVTASFLVPFEPDIACAVRPVSILVGEEPHPPVITPA